MPLSLSRVLPKTVWDGFILHVLSSGARLFVTGGTGHGGHVVSTSDGGSSWQPTAAQGVMGLRQLAVDGATLHAVGEYGTLMCSTDGGQTFDVQDCGGNRGCVFGVMCRKDSLYISGDSGVRRRDAHGAWKVLDTTSGLARLYDAANGKGDLIAVGDRGAILRVDSDDHVTRLSSGTSADLYGFTAVALAGRVLYVVVGLGGTVLTSVDDGRTFQAQKSGVTSDLYGVVVHEGSIVVLGKGIILRSKDGVHFTKHVDKARSFWSGAVHEGHLYIGGPSGLFRVGVARAKRPASSKKKLPVRKKKATPQKTVRAVTTSTTRKR